MEKENDEKLDKMIHAIRLDESIEDEAEQMRLGILDDIHNRMNTRPRTFLLRKISSVAASIALILGISGYFFFQSNWEINDTAVTLNNISGTKSVITLPDGSVVSLHGNSTITYPATFGRSNRIVQLDGEAFFEVKKDEKSPFIVQAGKVGVKVLGTSFNVEAYPEEDAVYITLQTGKISMNIDNCEGELVLSPNQQAIYNKETGLVTRRTVDAKEVSAWTSNKLYFNAMPLKEIVRKLSHHFDVEINIASPKLENIIYTGEFIEDEAIDDILTVLSMDDRIKYKRENNRVCIYE